MIPSPLFDPGLQPERTELAWRRTVLGIGVGSLLAIRLLPAAIGDPLWVLPGFVGILFAGAVWVAARRRYRRAHAGLYRSTTSAVDLSGGGLMLVLATFTALSGLLALALALALAFSVQNATP